MAAGFYYKGKEHSIESKRDFAHFVQLIATDLGAKFFQDQNRDMWLRDFSTRIESELKKLKNGVPALSIASLFSQRSQQAQLSGATTQAPASIVPVSPHRTKPGPTGDKLATGLATLTFDAESTDRAHSFLLDFTAAYPGGTNVCQVNFRTRYSSPPIVHIQQLDTLAAVNPRVLSVTATEYIVDCDPFLAGALYNFSVTVIHPSDPVD